MEKTSSAEKEFELWLRRADKTFQENLRFAISAWKSADFILSRKYEIVLIWLTEVIKSVEGSQDLQICELQQLTELHAHPGLVGQTTKWNLVSTILEVATKSNKSKSRQFAELLRSLSEFEVLQDIMRADGEIQPRLHSCILKQYILYLSQFGCDNEKPLDDKKLNSDNELEFFGLVLKTIKEAAKRASDKEDYVNAYSIHIAQPMTEVILCLRAHGLCFFNEFLDLERLVTEDMSDNALIARIVQLPLHAQILVMECGIANRRGVESFINLLLLRIFCNDYEEPALRLTIAAYTLEMLRKYDVNLSFAFNEGTALQFIGNCIYDWAKNYKTTNVREVLMLLCATLRLNPLTLEQHIFHLTTWIMVADKNGDDEQRLFVEYLVLLIDMFRRLSQVEKFVGNLLKSVKQWLENFELPVKSTIGKRKAQEKDAHSPKKRKRNTNDDAELIDDKEQAINVDKYLKILFSDFNKVKGHQFTTEAHQYESFPELRTIWPSDSVGMEFTRLVSGLVSKPSLVIWKTLLYGMKDTLEQLPKETTLSNNQLFLVDFYASLLCAYLNGCKLAEQYNIFRKQIDDQRDLTASILNQFGKYLLAREYNKRTVRAFLECIYAAVSFEHILGYYKPDTNPVTEESIVPSNYVHSYLSDKKFTLLQQRVLNFGNTQCKFLLNRLQMQKIETNILFDVPSALDVAETPAFTLQQSTLTNLNEPKQLSMLMQTSNGQWLQNHLVDEEKLSICKTLLSNSNIDQHLCTLSEDAKTLEFLVFSIYERLYNEFAELSKDSLLSRSQVNFETLCRDSNAKQLKQTTQSLITSINECDENHCPQLPTESINVALQQLKQLPISYIQRQTKSLIFALQLTLYCDVKTSNDTQLTADALDILTDMLQLGPRVPVFKYLDCVMLQKVFPVHQYTAMYETLFVGVKNEEKGSEQFLAKLASVLQQSQEQSKLSNDECVLMLMAIESLANLSGASAKRMRKHVLDLLGTYQTYIQSHFRHTNGEQPKKDKKFVSKTIAGFASYARAVLAQNAKTDERNIFVVDEEFRRLFKIYIGYSLDYRDSHSVRLVNVALNHRQQLNFAQNEIEFTLDSHWEQLNANLKDGKAELHSEKTAETVIKLIVAFKTNEDFLIMLKKIGNMLTDKEFLRVTQLLMLIAKCPFNTVKGAIFNEQCKQIIHKITLQLVRNEAQQFVDQELVLGILATQLAIVENKMLVVSLDTLDSILSFLIDINIKRLVANDSNVIYFTNLYMAMIELCIALVKYRHILLVDRVAQFMHIFKDLTRSLVWYKCDRENDSPITPSELEKLAELAVKLESLMHLIVNHSVNFKRISPFVLTFVISLMVADKRTTTLYPNIKKHIDSVCYDLVGLCDNRVGGFILRCSNEASRQVYETLVKNHTKYHKFKGKV